MDTRFNSIGRRDSRDFNRPRDSSMSVESSPARGEDLVMSGRLSTRESSSEKPKKFWVNTASFSVFAQPQTDGETTTPRLHAVASPNFSVVVVPNENTGEFDASLKAVEAQGEWVECRETLTGRILWYNSATNRLVFDNPPKSVQVVTNFATDEVNQLSYEQMIENRPIVPYENENVVESLLSLNSHEWNFNNDQVDVYRAKASRRDHSRMLPDPEQYVFPEYFSECPLPEVAQNQFLARVKLPNEFNPFRVSVAVRVKVAYTTVNDVIQQAVSKLDPPFCDLTNCWVLKVIGREEYMHGSKLISDYEAVRLAVRNEEDVEMVLSQQLHMEERIEEARQKQIEHCEHLETVYPDYVRAASFLDDASSRIGSIDHWDFADQQFIGLHECKWTFRTKIQGLTNTSHLPRFNNSIQQVYVDCEVWNGSDRLDGAVKRPTNPQAVQNDMRWGQWLSSEGLNVCDFPRESVVCFMVMGVTNNGDRQCLAWSRMPLIDARDRLLHGKYLLNMWEIPVHKGDKEGPKEDPYRDLPFRYRGTTTPKNPTVVDPLQCQLLVEFDEYPFDVIALKYGPEVHALEEVGAPLEPHELKTRQEKDIRDILDRSPLQAMTLEEQNLIWRARDLLWHDPKALPLFLRSVDWTNLACISEAHRYLAMWAPPKRVEDALEFLGYIYADTRVRDYAVQHLFHMHDADLQLYLLQLVQCLKYEPHHDSALAAMLIERGLNNPNQIGHYLFWHLKAELHDMQWAERFGVVMEEYLLHAGEHSRQLFTQNNIIRRFEIASEKVATYFKASGNKRSAECDLVLRRELEKINNALPDTFQIPLNPRWLASTLNLERCRYMTSKKVPLWLEFRNADAYAGPLKIMFKSGDDLRQDILTLQVMTIMDKVWLANNLDLRMKPYGVLATGINKHGEGVGMLEIVQRARTINDIYTTYGLLNGQSISKFIQRDHAEETHSRMKSDQALMKARDNFARSCAGYCVATYVLGIGDRHSDNIMVTEMGHFFHIDFGHFLGNFKFKFRIKRERSPFVFTPQMKYAIDNGEVDSAVYADFMEWCFKAYQILRDRNRLFINLFGLMVSAGMPELMKEEDIEYLTQTLNLDSDQGQARRSLQKEIKSSLRDFTRGLDNVFHNWRHR